MSTIDKLQRLHEAATPGTWGVFTKRGDDAFVEDAHSRFVSCLLDNDAAAVVALHNAWPAIHRVLVAARDWAEASPSSHAEGIAASNLDEALRALDDKEQRT